MRLGRIIIIKYWPVQEDVSNVHSITFDTSQDCRMVRDFEQLPVLLFAGKVNGWGESVNLLLTRVVEFSVPTGGLQSRHSPRLCWWGHCWVEYNVAHG